MTIRLTLPCLLAYFAMGCAAEIPPTFVIRDHLTHPWRDELVHFDFKVKGRADNLFLADAAGNPVPFQFTDLAVKGSRVSGKVWTVVSVEPGGRASFTLLPGKPRLEPGVKLQEKGAELILSNTVMAIALAKLPGELNPPAALTGLPPPLLHVAPAGGGLTMARNRRGASTHRKIRLLISDFGHGPMSGGKYRC
jgi:hypothetical protein